MTVTRRRVTEPEREAILNGWAAGLTLAALSANLSIPLATCGTVVANARHKGDKRAVRRYAMRDDGVMLRAQSRRM